MALFFAVGIFLGQFFAGSLPDEAGQELSDYLRQYMRLDADPARQTMMSTVMLYVRYPLTAVLLGFASVGVVLIPCLATVFGFFISFSISCFAAVFGTDGLWLAFAAFGVRCAITLPCFLVLAGASWGNTANLAALSFGKGRRVSPVIYGRSWWMRITVCLIVLMLGVCIDLAFVPFCLRRILPQILN